MAAGAGKCWSGVAAALLACLGLNSAQATVVGWMGGHSPEPQLGGSQPMSWRSWDDYGVFSQTSMTLMMAADPGYSPIYGLLPDVRYAPLADMVFSADNVGHTWRVDRSAANAADFDGMVGQLSNGRVDYMLWAFGDTRYFSTTDLNAFSYGSLPMYGYYHFQGDLTGQKVEWMSLTLESYAQWAAPNDAAYCQYAQCRWSNNLGFTYWLVFGNNDADPVPVPAPGTLPLSMLGLGGLAWRRRRVARRP